MVSREYSIFQYKREQSINAKIDFDNLSHKLMKNSLNGKQLRQSKTCKP